MIYRIVKLHFQTTKTTSFLELFNQVVTKVNEQPGCIEMYMIQDLHNPTIFITHSKWETEEDLNKYKELYEKFNFRWDIPPQEINGLMLISINEIINSIKLVDPNNTSGLIGFWNDVKLYIEKK